ncbi:MAG: DUF551 domain-containing protein [bacterium]|nr:DUF551 domain-containing protein [bacterium]
MEIREAIEVIKYASAFNSDNSRLTVALDMAISALEEQERNRWIQVSERLPEDGDFVVISLNNGYVSIGYLSRKQWYDYNAINFMYNGKIVEAWRPLPEQFKGGET